MKTYKSDILVIGSGAGAYGVVSELQKKNYTILIAEQGKRDVKFSSDVIIRAESIYKPKGMFPETDKGILYYRHIGVGGTIELSCGNGVLPSEKDLDSLGIDIKTELREVYRELNIKDMPDSLIGDNSRQLISSANSLGFPMKIMPKFIDFEKCSKCALCELTCAQGAKWSSKIFLETSAQSGNLEIIYNTKITEIKSGKNCTYYAEAVDVSSGEKIRFDTKYIVISAGGIGTPVILQNSGFESGSDLFFDMYVNVYGRSVEFSAERDIPMPAFYADPVGDFILSPYLDIELWYGLSKMALSKWFSGEHYYGLMVKIPDESNGHVARDGTILKGISECDRKKINRGVETAKIILLNAGVKKDSLIVTGAKAAHPGGTASIGKVIGLDFRLKGTDNVFIADASVFNSSPGKPPIVTIMALGKKLGKIL